MMKKTKLILIMSLLGVLLVPFAIYVVKEIKHSMNCQEYDPVVELVVNKPVSYDAYGRVTKTVAQVIDERMNSLKGALEIIGWEAAKINGQTFYVQYVFKTNNRELAYAYEVNRAANIVRQIGGDKELMKLYRVSDVSDSSVPIETHAVTKYVGEKGKESEIDLCEMK